MSERRLALVTGASAGIGRAFACFLAERGFDLAIAARREDRLEALRSELSERHGIDVLTIIADYSEPTAAQATLEQIRTAGREVDVLINCAGYSLKKSAFELPWADIRGFLEVMATSQLELMHSVLPGMTERDYGRVINVASLASFAPETAGGLYVGIKRFMVSFSWAAWLDHRGTNVHVTASCPGYTWSEFHDVLGNREQMNKLPKVMWKTSEEVVAESWRACERNRPEVVIGRTNRAIRALLWFLPQKLMVRLMPGPIRPKGHGRG